MESYRLEKVVGEGSFGKALLCSRKSDSKKCIIKQISLGKMSQKEAQQTEQEAKLLARFNHPNIVGFWESFQETRQGKLMLCIVMEYADGGDLSNLIKSRCGRPMPESQVLNITVQIALALKHVHDRKILHRDLKSQNIFLTSKGIVKLGDFGIAKVLRNTGELASTQIGTPYFMSPEILAGKRYNNKTDIWSLGCVTFELITLRVPFQGNSMKQLVTNIINTPVPPLPSRYSQELKSLVGLMLAKNFKERPSINTILSSSIFREKIGVMLTDQVRKKEFSHTVLHGDDILRAPFPFSNAAVSNIDLINQSPVVPLDPKSEQRNNLRANNQVHPQGQIRRQIEAAPSSRDKNIQQKPGLPKRESVSVKKSPDDGLKLNVVANGNKNRRISKPVVPQSIQRKPTELRVEGQLLSRSPKVSHQVKHVNNEARERRLRYEQVKERKPVKNAANVSPSVQSPNANWLNDLQHQMDALKNKINDLQSPSIKHDRRSPTVIQSRVSAPPTNSPPNVPTSSEDPLELRRKKREQERKKFQNFLKAQRQSQVSPRAPNIDELGHGISPSIVLTLHNEPSQDSQQNLSSTKHDLNQDFVLEPTLTECPVRDPGEELRLRRDKERQDLRNLIAQKRKEKKGRSNCEQSTFQDSEPKSSIDDQLLRSSFFNYSQDDVHIHPRSASPLSGLNLDQSQEDTNHESDVIGSPDVQIIFPPQLGINDEIDIVNANRSCPAMTTESDSDSEDVEYDKLLLAMKSVMDKTESDDTLEEFEEEENSQLHFLAENSCKITELLSIDEEISILDSHSSAKIILAEADKLFTKSQQLIERQTQDAQDDGSNDSWDEFSDHDLPEAHHLTVYGVPFPLGKTTCDLNGFSPEINTPASRMEALREYLENALGTDRFIKVYRLLKSVGPKDDDDELLRVIEGIIGVDGLCYMDTFFQLIHIEDKFESS